MEGERNAVRSAASRPDPPSWWAVTARVSGLALVLIGGVHLAVTSVFVDHVPDTVPEARARYAERPWQLLIWALITVGLVHALAALRVRLDAGRRSATVTGVVTFVAGTLGAATILFATFVIATLPT